MVHLRPSSANDEEFCRYVFETCYQEVMTRQFGPRDPSFFEREFHRGWQPGASMIIQVDREAIGVIRIEIRPECLFIHEIQILPSWQNKGIATKLLQEEITRACKLTLPVRLKVLRYNRAYKLYRRLGFSIIGTQRATYLMEYNAANSRLRTIAVKYKLDQLASKVVHCVLRGKAVTRSVLRRISNLRRRIGGGCVARRDI